VLKHCAANRKRWLSALPNVGPCIYHVSISDISRSSIYIYIYDISTLRVNYSPGHWRHSEKCNSSTEGCFERRFPWMFPAVAALLGLVYGCSNALCWMWPHLLGHKCTGIFEVKWFWELHRYTSCWCVNEGVHDVYVCTYDRTKCHSHAFKYQKHTCLEPDIF